MPDYTQTYMITLDHINIYMDIYVYIYAYIDGCRVERDSRSLSMYLYIDVE